MPFHRVGIEIGAESPQAWSLSVLVRRGLSTRSRQMDDRLLPGRANIYVFARCMVAGLLKWRLKAVGGPDYKGRSYRTETLSRIRPLSGSCLGTSTIQTWISRSFGNSTVRRRPLMFYFSLLVVSWPRADEQTRLCPARVLK
jgi:hypothetical protein